MDKKEIVESRSDSRPEAAKRVVEFHMKETGSVFEALELALKQIYKKKVQEMADILHVHSDSFKMTVIHGMNLVEKDTEDKKTFLLDILRVVYARRQVDWDLVGDMVDVVVYATQGKLKVNARKRGCF
jgi:hypothetical protein